MVKPSLLWLMRWVIHDKERCGKEMTIIRGERINLQFASQQDMKKIYDMMVSDEIIHFMFDEQHPAPSWEDFRNDEEDFFPGSPSKDGSYLLIILDGQVVGSISYACGYEKIPYAEFDIWMSGYEFMGQGIGCEAVLMLRSFVNENYGIEHYIIRPWTKNLSAIKAYNKCGFRESASFNLEHYYSDEDLVNYGDGDYGKGETLNLYYDMSCELV